MAPEEEACPSVSTDAHVRIDKTLWKSNMDVGHNVPETECIMILVVSWFTDAHIRFYASVKHCTKGS